MAKLWFGAFVLVALYVTACPAQTGGNVTYSGAGGKARAEQAERARRTLTREELPPSPTGTFVEAAVLMNVKADEYVALFGIAREGESVADAGRKTDATVRGFTDALKPLGVGKDDVHVDFVGQTKVYGFEVTGDIAREKLVGFEHKKNVSVRYKDPAVLDKLLVAAAGVEVYDLIKVDYVVVDTRAVQDKLAAAAAAVVKRKKARYETLLGIKLGPPGQVFAERSGVYQPAVLYDSYTAFGAEEMSNGVDRQRYATRTARKTRTSFFNGLDADGFDEVINPVVVEPVVQFFYYLKLKFEVEQARAR